MKAVPLTELVKKTGKSRQLLMFHLKSLQEEHPKKRLYYKDGRSNYVTQEGMWLLEKKLSGKSSKRKSDAQKKKAKKTQKKEKEKNEEFALLEELLHSILAQQETLNETIEKLHKDIQKKDKQIEELHHLLAEQQRITIQQQELALLDKKGFIALQSPLEASQEKDSKASALDKARIYIKAFRNSFLKNNGSRKENA